MGQLRRKLGPAFFEVGLAEPDDCMVRRMTFMAASWPWKTCACVLTDDSVQLGAVASATGHDKMCPLAVWTRNQALPALW